MEVSWKELLKERITGKEKNIPWFLHDKIKCHDFCIENNINTPKIFEIFEQPEAIQFKNITDNEFILKPTLESSTKGVMVLRRQENNLYFDSLSKKSYDLKQIIEIQESLFKKNKNKSNRIIIEEKIYDENQSYDIPRDFKFYAFNGNIAAIVQINRNGKPALITWYDKKFNLLDDGIITCNPKYVTLSNENEKPKEWETMLEVASEVSRKIKTPFARIDMYSSTKGPTLGEITLAPGGLYHGLHYTLSPDEDKKWGKYWMDAIEELNQK